MTGVIRRRLPQYLPLERQLFSALFCDISTALRSEGPLAAVECAHAWVDRWRETFGAAGLGCGPRCGHCCRLPVDISPPEAVAILRSLRAQLPATKMRTIEQRIAKVAAVTQRMTESERIAADVACPLLEDEQCIAYQHRPLGCRTHTSIDAQRCANNRANPNGERQMRAEDTVVGAHALLALVSALAAEGAKPMLVELSIGLERALVAPAKFRRLLNGRDVCGGRGRVLDHIDEVQRMAGLAGDTSEGAS